MPTILTENRQHAARLAAELIRAAGAEAHLIRKRTGGKRPAFDVPDSVYEKWIAGEGSKGEVEQAQSQGDEPTTPADPPIVSGEPQPPIVDDEPTVSDDEPAVADSDGETDEDELPELPDRNDSTEKWAEYMHAAYGIDTTDMKRRDLIAEYDRRNDVDGE